jgi:hypothetical protein
MILPEVDFKQNKQPAPGSTPVHFIKRKPVLKPCQEAGVIDQKTSGRRLFRGTKRGTIILSLQKWTEVHSDRRWGGEFSVVRVLDNANR